MLRLLLVAITALLAMHQVAGELVIENAERQIIANTQRVVFATTLTIKNTGRAAVQSVTVCEQAALRQHSAMYEVGVLDGKEFSSLTGGKPSQPPGAPADVACDDYPQSIAPGASASLAVKAVFTEALRLHPAEVAQGSPQLVLLSAGAQLASPYRVAQQTTVVELGSGAKVESYTKEPGPAVLKGGKLTYGPYSDVGPCAQAPFTVHYENNSPFAQASEVVREVEVSHWGSVYFEEEYSVRNAGAKVKGEWSRYDYMIKPEAGKSAIRELHAVLLPGAESLYYRDGIGNISSSAARATKEGVAVALAPRYPIFGGWSAKFTFGWSMPLEVVVARQARHTYSLSTLLGPAVTSLVVDELVVKVVLPEGASYVGVECKLDLNVSFEKKYTYFDIGGRTVVVLRKTNVVPEMNVPFTVNYSYPLLAMLQKPLLLVAAFAAFFVALMAYSRANLSIDNGNGNSLAKLHTS